MTVKLVNGVGSDLQVFGYDEGPLPPDKRAAERAVARAAWRRYRQELYLDQDRQPFAVVCWHHTTTGIRILRLLEMRGGRVARPDPVRRARPDGLPRTRPAPHSRPRDRLGAAKPAGGAQPRAAPAPRHAYSSPWPCCISHACSSPTSRAAPWTPPRAPESSTCFAGSTAIQAPPSSTSPTICPPWRNCAIAAPSCGREGLRFPYSPTPPALPGLWRARPSLRRWPASWRPDSPGRQPLRIQATAYIRKPIHQESPSIIRPQTQNRSRKKKLFYSQFPRCTVNSRDIPLPSRTTNLPLDTRKFFLYCHVRAISFGVQ